MVQEKTNRFLNSSVLLEPLAQGRVGCVPCQAAIFDTDVRKRKTGQCPERTRDDGQTRQRVWTLSKFFFFCVKQG